MWWKTIIIFILLALFLNTLPFRWLGIPPTIPGIQGFFDGTTVERVHDIGQPFTITTVANDDRPFNILALLGNTLLAFLVVFGFSAFRTWKHAGKKWLAIVAIVIALVSLGLVLEAPDFVKIGQFLSSGSMPRYVPLITAGAGDRYREAIDYSVYGVSVEWGCLHSFSMPRLSAQPGSILLCL